MKFSYKSRVWSGFDTSPVIGSQECAMYSIKMMKTKDGFDI